MTFLIITAGVMCFLICLLLACVSLYFIFRERVPAAWWMLSIAGSCLAFHAARLVLGV